ncbi:Cell morphogenesis protein PAG1 [Malassezia cuniculi]|uniref:Cell morphogenesis protein PAG1 n=1 Tax=Malassezia cuniculi TaxID=948313 RepID=A0AAF0J9T9_9BASI|nr:Cell morphogenesis protein PAG1 [Malassezia cuniculi]
MDDGAQVVIPDLDEEEYLLEPAFVLGDDPRARHANNGSMDDGMRTLRYGTPPALHSPPRSERTPGFSFPVKKMSSFASLRAALMGGQSPAPTSAPPVEPVSPFFALSDETPQQRRPSRGAIPLADVAAASSGLAHVTGLVRTPRRHTKSASVTSAAEDGAKSPVRAVRHAHHGSQFSETSIGGISMSTQSSGIDVPELLNDHELATPPLMQLPWETPSASPDMPRAYTPVRAPTLGVNTPQRPVELALNQLLGRLVAVSDVVVDDVLSARPDAHIDEVLLHSVALQSAFGTLLDALAHVARQTAPPVFSSLIAWRTLASERPDGAPRRALAVTLLACRALLAVAQALPAEALADPRVDEFESAAFSMLHQCSLEREKERGGLPRLQRTLQQRAFESVSQLLGELSRQRISSVGGHFVQILQQANALAGTRNTELLTEAAILGMRHLRISVYPMEMFEEGCEFLEILARFYMHAHGYRTKRAFAHVLSAMLLPVAGTASVEVNHPVWTDAIRTILARAQTMSTRPRYWSVAYPLWTAALCAAPAELFMTQWNACLDAGVSRLKDRVSRSHILICAARLLWVYLFRCHEGTNPTAKRLDSFFALWFPPNRTGVVLGDARLDAHVAMVHYTLYRQFEYAKGLVLDLLRQQVLDDPAIVHQADLLAPTRMAVAVRAVARTVTSYATGTPPAFALDSPQEETQESPDQVPTYPRQDMAAMYARFAELIGRIALICDYHVKDATVFDERIAIAMGGAIPQIDRVPVDRDTYILRSHAGGAFTVAVARDQLPFLDLLRTCFDAWPLCAPASLSRQTLHTLLFRALYSTEPPVHRAAARALVRFAEQRDPGAHALIGAYIRWAFQQDGFVWELVSHAELLLPKMAQTVAIFLELLDVWWTQLKAGRVPDDAISTVDEIEACALCLLAAPLPMLRGQAVTVLRLVGLISNLIGGARTTRAVVYVNKPAREFAVSDPSAPAAERTAAARWLAPDSPADAAPRLAHLAEAADSAAETLWFDALPRMLQAYQGDGHGEHVVSLLHTHISSRVRALEGSLFRSPTPLIRDVWHAYTLVLCATAPENAHGSVQRLVPYVRSNDTAAREAAVAALAYTTPPAYTALLDALEPLCDDARASLANRVALGRVLYETAPHMHSAPAAAPRLTRWISDVLSFLEATPDRHELELYRLRRYFCGVVEHYASVLGTAVPYELRRRLVALFAVWNATSHAESTAPDIAARISAAVAECADMRECERVMVLMRPELELITKHTDAALGALAVVQLGAQDLDVFDPTPFFGWADSMFKGKGHAMATRAILRLVEQNAGDVRLSQELLARAHKSMCGPASFFHVLVDAFDTLSLSPAQAICVALAGLGHQDANGRLRALALLSSIARREGFAAVFDTHSVDVASASTGSYFYAQRRISSRLAAEFSSGREIVLAEGAKRLQDMSGAQAAAFSAALCPWAELVILDDSSHIALDAFLTVGASQIVSETDMRVLWSSVFRNDANCDTTAIFLVNEVQRRRNSVSLDAAQMAMACMAESSARQRVLRRLCSIMEPASVVVPPEEVSTADTCPIAPALAALFLASELVRSDVPPELALMLHLICIVIDSAAPALSARAITIAQQVLRTLGAPQSTARVIDATRETPRRMDELVAVLKEAALPHCSNIVECWGGIALRWATLLPVRRMASCSFYVFRELLPKLTNSMLNDMFVRLAGTVSEVGNAKLQHFVIDVIDTLQIAVKAAAVTDEHVTKVFWAAAACLSTVNEKEYARALALLNDSLDRIKLDSLEACQAFAETRPESWNAQPGSLLRMVVRGLRSADQCDAAFEVLVRFTRASHFFVVDKSDAKQWLIRATTMALPWWLEACALRLGGADAQELGAARVNPESVSLIAVRLAALTEEAGLPDIARVAASVSKDRFRTTDDLVRQTIMSVCAGAQFEHSAVLDMATMLLHLTFNPRDWVCLRALHALKVLFGVMAQRNIQLVPHGREMLVPLLRLLPLPLAPRALEVLDEQIEVPCGQAVGLDTNDLGLFGAPAASGWGVAQPHAEMERTRENIHAVWRMCEQSPGEPALNTSLSFVDEDERAAREPIPDDADMGALANQLSDLASFFTQDGEDALHELPMTPNMSHASFSYERPESQVAKILARSTFGARDSMLFAARREYAVSDVDISALGDASAGRDPISFDASFVSSPGIRSSTPAKGTAPALCDPFLTRDIHLRNNSSLQNDRAWLGASPLTRRGSDSSLSDQES